MSSLKVNTQLTCVCKHAMHVPTYDTLGIFICRLCVPNGLSLPGSFDVLAQSEENGRIHSIHHESRACKSNVITATVNRISLKDVCLFTQEYTILKNGEIVRKKIFLVLLLCFFPTNHILAVSKF